MLMCPIYNVNNDHFKSIMEILIVLGCRNATMLIAVYNLNRILDYIVSMKGITYQSH